MNRYLGGPHQGDAKKPEEHYGSEDRTESACSEPLDSKEQDQDHHGGCGSVGHQRGMNRHDPLDGTEHRDSRRQGPVRQKQRRTEDDDCNDPETNRPGGTGRFMKGKEGKDLEFIFKRPRSNSGVTFDHMARKVEIGPITILDEKGLRN